MKKIIIIAAAFIGFTTAANAQNTQNASANASQTVQLQLSNALEISFTSNNNATGSTVSLPFSAVAHYANGVESTEQELKVRSNKNFTVTVKTNNANFTFSNGGSVSSSNMPVSVLGLALTDNSTGGQVGQGFSASTYKSLSNSAQSLITNANNGGNQTFAVKYKATPGFAYPAGTYTTDVVYTATQQ